jgi:hypothetical protein
MSEVSLLTLWRQKREIEISNTDEHCSDPTAESTEVLVENRTCSVGQRLLRKFVETLVSGFDRMFRAGVIGCERRLDCECCSLEDPATDWGTLIGKLIPYSSKIGSDGDALNSEHDFDLDRRSIFEFLFEIPLAICSLAPRGPIERDVSEYSRRSSFTGKAIAGFPAHITEENIDAEVLLEGLSFEKGTFEGVAQGADDIGEDVIEHTADPTADWIRFWRNCRSEESATMAT